MILGVRGVAMWVAMWVVGMGMVGLYEGVVYMVEVLWVVLYEEEVWVVALRVSYHVVWRCVHNGSIGQ